MMLLNNKAILVTVIVVALALVAYFTVQYIQSGERDKVTIELQEETNEVRERIKEAVRPKPRSNPDDATDSLQYLRDR